MILSGHQPGYLPFIGLFHKIAISDKFIFVDGVQLEKKSWQTRNRIRIKEGWIWLSVPILTASRFSQTVAETEICNDTPWQRKHWKALCLHYGKGPYFKAHAPFFEEVYTRKWTSLADLNKTIIRHLLAVLQIETPVYEQSDFAFKGKKTELLVEMCQALGADTYLSNTGSSVYVDETLFAANGLRHRYQEFAHPVYRQLYEPFIPFLSAIDLLFNEGERARKIILGCGPRPPLEGS